LRAGNDRVGLSPVVAEFDERGFFVERLDDCANLCANEPLAGQVPQKRDGAQRRRLVVAVFRRNKTQQVTKRGTPSPSRTIQMDRTMGAAFV
jgi:hypothetical protein